ncbi:hypothetical protein K3217_03020 [bacterium BD-1]|nr:hypothetical protein [Ottowia caeni]
MPLFIETSNLQTSTAYIKPGLLQKIKPTTFETKIDSSGEYSKTDIHKAVEKFQENTEKLSTSIPQTDQTIVDAITKIKKMALAIKDGMIGPDDSEKATFSEYYIKKFMITGFSDYEQFIELATQKEIPLPLRQNAIKSLASAHNVCADGILSNIESAARELLGASKGAPATFYHRLNQSIDTEIMLWLNTKRKESPHYQQDHIVGLLDGNEIHTANQIYNEIAPHFGLEKREDSFSPALRYLVADGARCVQSKVTENSVIICIAKQCLDDIHNLYKSEGLKPGTSYPCETDYSKASATHEKVVRDLSQSYGTIEFRDYLYLTEDDVNFTISTDTSLIEKRIIKNLKLADIIYHKPTDILGKKGDALRIKKGIDSYYTVELDVSSTEAQKTYSSLQAFLQKTEEHVNRIEEKLAQEGSLASNIFNLNISKDGSVRLIYDTVHLIKNNQVSTAISKYDLIWTSDLVNSQEIGLIILGILKSLSKPEYKESCKDFIQQLPPSIVQKVVETADHASDEFRLFYELLSSKMIRSGVRSSTGNQSIIKYVLARQPYGSRATERLLSIMSPEHYSDLLDIKNSTFAFTFEYIDDLCGLDTALQYFRLLLKHHEAHGNFSMDGFFNQYYIPTRPVYETVGINFEELKPPEGLLIYLMSRISSKHLEGNFSYITNLIANENNTTILNSLLWRTSRESPSPSYYIDFIKNIASRTTTADPQHSLFTYYLDELLNSINTDLTEIFTPPRNGKHDTTLLELLIERNCSRTLEKIASAKRYLYPNDFPPEHLEFWLNFTLSSLEKSIIKNQHLLISALDDIFCGAYFDAQDFQLCSNNNFNSSFSTTLTKALTLGLDQTALRLMEMANKVDTKGTLDNHQSIYDLIEKSKLSESGSLNTLSTFTHKYLGTRLEVKFPRYEDFLNTPLIDDEPSDWQLASSDSDSDSDS